MIKQSTEADIELKWLKKMGHGTGVIAQQVEKSNCYCRGLEFGP